MSAVVRLSGHEFIKVDTVSKRTVEMYVSPDPASDADPVSVLLPVIKAVELANALLEAATLHCHTE